MIQPYWPETLVHQVGTQPTLTDITGAQTLYQFPTFEAGLLNTVDTRLWLRGTIAYTTGPAETPGITLEFGFDDGTDLLNVISISSTAVAPSNNDSPIRFSFNCVTETGGSPAAFIATGEMFVSSLGTTTARNMQPDWLSADPLDATQPLIARLRITASSNLSSARLIECFLGVK